MNSNIMIGPKELKQQAGAFKASFQSEVYAVIDSVKAQLDVIGIDWKGKAAESNVKIFAQTLSNINIVGDAGFGFANNLEIAAAHAAKRDEDAALGGGGSWGVVATIDTYKWKELACPTIDANSLLAITKTSVDAVGKIDVEIKKIDTLISDMETQYKSIVTAANWETGYDSIKNAIEGYIKQAKTAGMELTIQTVKTSQAIKSSYEAIMADATVSSVGSSGPTGMTQ